MNRKIILFFILLIILTGCVKITSERPKIHYYVIAFSPDNFERKEPSAKIEVEPFTISQIYHTDKFIYRTNEYEITKDFYNRWIIKPDSFITEYIRNYIHFNILHDDNIKQREKFKIRGHIYEFYAKIEEKRLDAVINLRVELYRFNNIKKTYDLISIMNYCKSTSTEETSVNGYIRSMKKDLNDISKNILKDIYKYSGEIE
ncbi:MAG: hypothetical protein FXF49_02810 [Flexistipes sinusarabici]|uniref:ABC-type transport auxiliary lipoprotein component domain-containing protein n=1 Tax=Flexistipes sinusarabici TaxID=2352 RepID=A0A5D0MR02_FLESI|nr:hypothetical protein [Flexistipes sinusarabici]TYB34191.1 MAG: hypothetical protein FXF49_02810 [Flexistipes sinusarabici]